MEIAKDTKIPLILVANDCSVSYKDERGLIRTNKIEESDDNYREIENKPIIGLKVEGHKGGHYSRWEHFYYVSREYVTIKDPRGFHVNITVPNFLYIVANSTIENGLIKDEMIWAWNRGYVLLMPTNTEDYKEILEYSKVLNRDKSYSVKDLVVGKKYLIKGNEEVYYLGRHQYYRTTRDVLCKSGYKWNGGYSDLFKTKKASAHYAIDASVVEYGIGDKSFTELTHCNSIFTIRASNVIDEFEDMMNEEEINLAVDFIYKNDRFNPINYIKVKEYKTLPFDKFVDLIDKEKNKLDLSRSYDFRMANFYVENEDGLCNSYIKFYRNPNGDDFKIDVETILRTENDKMLVNFDMTTNRRASFKVLDSLTLYVDNLNLDEETYKTLYKFIKPVTLVYTSEDGRNVKFLNGR